MLCSNDVSFDFNSLRTRYLSGELTPAEVAELVLQRTASLNDPAIFIHLLPSPAIRRQVDELEARARAAGGALALPLYGLPFAVKDNIDVAGIPTTAACAAFAYTPGRSATAVDRLCGAGALLVGKTNLDQFATGLVGTRSPYGTPRNPFHPDYIPGGSSSGSAVAVSAGLVSFALGTDTAGSGRVPAGLNNIVGLKPTRGRISAAGVVPACRSLDCISVFALTCHDAAEVLDIVDGYDSSDPFSRGSDFTRPRDFSARRFRFGVPRPDQLEFFRDEAMAALYSRAVGRLSELGGQRVEIDFAPFAQTARLLYDGAWLAERWLVIRELVERQPGALLDVTRSIISGGRDMSAADAFAGFHELKRLRAATRQAWGDIDLLLVPTAGTAYKRAAIDADTVRLNTNLGFYTNFVNLLDLSAVALPAGFGKDGVPGGVTLIAPAGGDEALLALGQRFQRLSRLPLGATGHALPQGRDRPPAVPRDWVRVAVMGAHLSGLPLNYQLVERGAFLEQPCRTAPCYRFFALPGTTPPKPGMVRVGDGTGVAIEVEIWAMGPEQFGTFVAAIPPPLGIGSVQLEDGSFVKGFLSESVAVEGAEDISEYGGWRRFLAARSQA
jgi:allophanate hydrolase